MAGLTGRKLIASRCAKFFKDGDFVNLGIGVVLMCILNVGKEADREMKQLEESEDN